MMTFETSVTSSGEQTSISIDSMKTGVSLHSNYADSSGSDPDVLTEVFGTGSFATAAGATVLYPDGTVLSVGSGSRDLGYNFGLQDEAFLAVRQDYKDAGSYAVSLSDVNGLGDSSPYNLDLDTDRLYLPQVTTPQHDTSIDLLGGPLTISWDFPDPDPGEAQSVIVFVETKDWGDKVFAKVVESSVTFIDVPNADMSVFGWTFYNIIVVAVDIPAGNLPDPVTFFSSYSYTTVKEELFYNFDHKIQFFGAVRLFAEIDPF